MRTALRGAAIVLLLGVASLVGFCQLSTRGHLGNRQDAGTIHPLARAATAPAAPGSQILFGDLHVHTTFSFDAYMISLPMYQGEGSHPPADACDYARFCSALDFWSINDHAEGLTPHQWSETRELVRQCNDVAGDPSDPDLVTYLGWEWTQIGTTPDDHYGHKNVVLLETDDAKVPARPISSRQELFPGGENPYTTLFRFGLIAAAPGGSGRQPYYDFATFLQDRDDLPGCPEGVPVRDLPRDCQESAATPSDLFGRLDDWQTPYMVIPHGNTWGFYTPPGTTWDKQLAAHDDPDKREFLIEVFSGHGNIEQYRDWQAIETGNDGDPRCPEPSAGFTPECWRAGQIIEARCHESGDPAEACAAAAAEARANHVAANQAGHLTVPGAEVADWLDSGQCTDCYMPAYNHRPGGSVQYALARRDFSVADPADPSATAKRFRFGLIGSSDVHTARPGTGYKERMRRRTTDAALGQLGPPPALTRTEPAPRSIAPDEISYPGPYFERFASFFGTGGLVAVHSDGRDRHAIWDALQRKEVYATSGERILLWFDLQSGASDSGGTHPMGSSLESSQAPTFTVRALGAFEQRPGCPPDALNALGEERLELLCGGECYHPSDQRKRIDRIEVVRIRPQAHDTEAIADLVEDPWQVLPCPLQRDLCEVSFSDPDFENARRDSVYYVRAIQEASPTINAGGLRCDRDADGACTRVDPCAATDPTAYSDDCLTPAEERAWSSPIFVDWRD